MNPLSSEDRVPLAMDDLKALRNADDVSFHFIREPRGSETQAFIKATRRADPGDGFGARELVRIIPADFKFTIYERNGDSGRRDPSEAYTSALSAKFQPEWSTAARLLKRGDRLILHWTGGNTHQGLRDAGFNVTHFNLEVVRDMPSDRHGARSQHLTFRLDTAVSGPSSFAPIKF